MPKSKKQNNKITKLSNSDKIIMKLDIHKCDNQTLSFRITLTLKDECIYELSDFYELHDIKTFTLYREDYDLPDASLVLLTSVMNMIKNASNDYFTKKIGDFFAFTIKDGTVIFHDKTFNIDDIDIIYLNRFIDSYVEMFNNFNYCLKSNRKK